MFVPNKLNYVVTILFVFLTIGQLSAQDYIPYSLYFKNWKIVNPAMAGLDSGQRFDIMYRAQGIDIEGHPSYSQISYEAKINRINSGVGFIFDSYQTGFSISLISKFQYNYQLNLSESHYLRLGSNFSVLSDSYNFDQYDSPTDPAFLGLETNTKSFGADVGALYVFNNLNLGMSVRDLFQTHKGTFGAQNLRSFLFHAEYSFDISIFEITPTVLYFRRENQSDIVDLNGVLSIYDFLQVGGTISLLGTHDSFNYYTGINIGDKFQVMALIYSDYFNYQPSFDLGKNFELQLSLRID